MHEANFHLLFLHQCMRAHRRHALLVSPLYKKLFKKKNNSQNHHDSHNNIRIGRIPRGQARWFGAMEQVQLGETAACKSGLKPSTLNPRFGPRQGVGVEHCRRSSQTLDQAVYPNYPVAIGLRNRDCCGVGDWNGWGAAASYVCLACIGQGCVAVRRTSSLGII